MIDSTWVSNILVILVVFLVLHYIKFVAELALLFISIHVADCIMHWIKDPFKEKRLIPRLNEKAVLITGCDTGFGHELAQKLDSIGLTVFAGCLFPDGAGAQELKTKCSKNLDVVPLDITNDDQVNEAVKYIKEALKDKKLWSVVNNAGILDYGDIELCSFKNIQNVFDVNVLGTVRVTKAFLPLVRKAQGRIVIVSSKAGSITMNALTPYSMSKHAEISLADGLRREMMKFGVTVHSIEPWMYRTNLNSPEGMLKMFKANWDEAPKDVTSDYGEDFRKDYIEFVGGMQQHFRPPSKTPEVVDALVEAAVGENPKMRYELGTVWILKLFMFFPRQWLDNFLYSIGPDKKFKKSPTMN